MTLVLDLPQETEARLRVVAGSRGQEVGQMLTEAATRSVMSLEQAGEELNLAASALREMAGRGELESVQVQGHLFFVRDARFDALQLLQNDRLSGLQEIARLSQEAGLYDE